jgi:hypothetical protein
VQAGQLQVTLVGEVLCLSGLVGTGASLLPGTERFLSTLVGTIWARYLAPQAG